MRFASAKVGRRLTFVLVPHLLRRTIIVPSAWHAAQAIAVRYQCEGVDKPGAARIVEDLGYLVLPAYRDELTAARCCPGRACVDHRAREVLVVYDLPDIEREFSTLHEAGHVILRRFALRYGERFHVPSREAWCDRFAWRVIDLGLARLG